MTVKETLEQIKKELFFELENMRNQIERLDDKITNIKDEIQKDQKSQEKDFEHLKERVNLKIENMQNNIDWINKYTDNDRSDNKEKKTKRISRRWDHSGDHYRPCKFLRYYASKR